MKIDELEIIANKNFCKVNYSIDNSDPEITTLNFHGQILSEKFLSRAKVSFRISSRNWKAVLIIFFWLMSVLHIRENFCGNSQR